MVNDSASGGMGRGGHLRKALGMMDILAREGLRNRAYCLVLADNCLLFLNERVCDESVPGAFGFTPIHTREHSHPKDEEDAQLTENRASLVIPYERLRRVTISKGFSSVTMRWGYKLDLEYLDPSNRSKRLVAIIVRPDSLADSGRESKAARGDFMRAYAVESEGLLRRSLGGIEGITFESSL